MALALPSMQFKDSFIEAVKEFQNDDDYTTRSQWYRRIVISELEANFESFVAGELNQAKEENLEEGRVPCSQYWLVEDGKFIGRVSVRHRLNERLMTIGGHIGYDIRPSMRGRGYGNKILELALAKAKELGIERALVTCDLRNIASRKIIEKNGGVLENQIPNPEMDSDALRFWIEIR